MLTQEQLQGKETYPLIEDVNQKERLMVKGSELPATDYTKHKIFQTHCPNVFLLNYNFRTEQLYEDGYDMVMLQEGFVAEELNSPRPVVVRHCTAELLKYGVCVAVREFINDFAKRDFIPGKPKG